MARSRCLIDENGAPEWAALASGRKRSPSTLFGPLRAICVAGSFFPLYTTDPLGSILSFYVPTRAYESSVPTARAFSNRNCSDLGHFRTSDSFFFDSREL